jgi:hypothetical protein
MYCTSIFKCNNTEGAFSIELYTFKKAICEVLSLRARFYST